MSDPTPDVTPEAPAATAVERADAALTPPAGEAVADPEPTVAVRPVAFSPLDGAAAGGAPAADGDARPIDLILDVQVPIVVELGHTQMPIEDILALKPGAVIELDGLANEPVDLLIRDQVIARGEIIVVDDNFGLRITAIVDPNERVAQLSPTT